MSQIDRTFDLLEALHTVPAGLPLSTLSGQLGLPKSAVHRLLAVLKSRGYVEQSGDGGHYRATLKLSLIGARFFSATSIREFLEPTIVAVARECGELTRLSLLIGGELIWILSSPGREHGLRYDGHSGRRVAPHTTATGRVWLASMSDEEAVAKSLAAGLGKPDRGQLGPNAIQSVHALLEEIALTRRRGFGMVIEEAEVGVSSVAVAIGDARAGRDDAFRGALSLAGPSARLTEERMEAAAGRLREVAADLASILVGWDEFSGRLDPADLEPFAAEESISATALTSRGSHSR